jgi:ribosome maturation factor RimP
MSSAKTTLKMAIDQAVERILPQLEALGFELVDTQVKFSSSTLVARLTIDKVISDKVISDKAITEKSQAAEQQASRQKISDQLTSHKRLANRRSGSQVTLDDCAAFSKKLSDILDEIYSQQGPEYILEVSSPGLDRPLRSEGDFERFNGSLAKIKIHIDGRTARYTGRLLTTSKPYRLSTQSGEITFGLDTLVSARLEPEL